MNPMNTKAAWLAVYERAKQLRKANGFHHDLDPQAIFPGFVTPSGPGSPGKLPYLCIPAEDDLPFPEEQDWDAAVPYQIKVPLVVYFPGKKGKAFADSTGAEAWDWLDDLLRLFLPTEDERWFDNLKVPVIRDVVFLKKYVIGDPVEGGTPRVGLELGIKLISSRNDLAA